jgi:hypothetical protein
MQLSILFCMLVLTITSSAKITGPVKAIYIDYQGFSWANPTDAIKSVADAGFNLIILAFYLNSGPADMTQAWQGASDAAKKAAVDYAHSKGAYVTVSAGGATDSPYTSTGADYGKKAAQFAKDNYLDGVDFDMENFQPGLIATGKSASDTIQWLVDASNAARTLLGNDAIITHAPQAPYFGKIGGGAGTNTWTQTSGGYTAVYQKAPHIDYFLIQFYNQGATCYTNYKGIFEDSSDCSPFPGTSIKEIANYGIPMEKLVLGKPVRQGDASNGYNTGAELNAIVKQARLMGWNTGVMGWVWSGQDSIDWIQSIYPNSTNAPVTAPSTVSTAPVVVVNTTTAPAATPAPVVAVNTTTTTAATPAPVVAAAPQATANTTTTVAVTAPQTAAAPKNVTNVNNTVVAVATPKTNQTTSTAVPATQPQTVAAPQPAPTTVSAPQPKPTTTSTSTSNTGAPTQKTCISTNPAKVSDAWCRSTNCVITGVCKLV